MLLTQNGLTRFGVSQFSARITRSLFLALMMLQSVFTPQLRGKFLRS